MKKMRIAGLFLLLGSMGTLAGQSLFAQEKSVAPGINDNFQKPDVTKYKETFEGESREIFKSREAIVAACQIREGESIADVGAGTGLFTRLFAAKVGPKGTIQAVDIAQNFLDHINKTAKDSNLTNIKTILADAKDSRLAPESADLVFICDTYHHFEFPQRTLESLHRALKKEGRLVVIDFERIEGKSREWTMKHVRAGREVFQKEIETAGFERMEAKTPEGLAENYFLMFRKKGQ